MYRMRLFFGNGGDAQMDDVRKYQTAHIIVRLGNAVIYRRNRLLKELGLTSSQSDAILYILRRAPGEVCARELMEELQLSQSTVAGILRRLEEKGLIERAIAAQDARRGVIRATVEGLCLEQRLRDLAARTQEDLLRDMSARERAQFARLLGKALENLTKERAQEGM